MHLLHYLTAVSDRYSSQVVLLLILLLLTMSAWHWTCGDGRRTTDNTENLLQPADEPHGHLVGHAVNFVVNHRATRGRTSLDSTVSCVVCFDGAIDCVLMPCAHEVACHRCASQLVLCPICRQNVGSTLRVFAADTEVRERALAQALEQQHAEAQQQQQEEERRRRQQPGGEDDEGADHDGDVEQTQGTIERGGDGTHQQQQHADGAPATESAGDDSSKPGGKEAAPGLAAMLCLRCASNPPNCVFLPCSHKIWCVDCAANLPPACPICNTGITQSLKTFHKRL